MSKNPLDHFTKLIYEIYGRDFNMDGIIDKGDNI